MSDSIQDVTRDLARFVRQQQEEGVEWYLDEGEPTVSAPVVVPPAEQATVHPAAVPAESAPPVDAAKTRRENEFRQHCELFVASTLALIEQNDPPDADATVPQTREQKATSLAEVAAEVAVCEACKLHPTRTRTVFGVGDPDANLVFIGEAPGRNEDEQGEPFVGRAGKLLTDILKAIGFDRDDVYICNILKCRPPENRDPEADEVRECEPYLKRQLAIIQPKVICCLGRHAAMTLLQTKASLKSMRETVHFYEGVPVMATFHPAALLRNPNWKKDTWDDVRKLKALHDALSVDSPDQGRDLR